ncbi:MAG: hypothetical protein ACREDR_36165, partial [Blastocatellia bacterium]
VLTYVRKDEREELLVAINLSNRAFSCSVDVASAAGYIDITLEVYRLPRPAPSGTAQNRSGDAAVTGSLDSPGRARSGASGLSPLPRVYLPAWGVKVFIRRNQ